MAVKRLVLEGRLKGDNLRDILLKSFIIFGEDYNVLSGVVDGEPEVTRIVKDILERYKDERTKQEKVERMKDQMAERAGLNKNDIEIVMDETGTKRVKEEGAQGIEEGGRIFLDAARFEPDRREDKETLGHELAHVAQVKKGRYHLPTRYIEAEAETLGKSIVAGKSIGRTMARLDMSRMAARKEDDKSNQEKPDGAEVSKGGDVREDSNGKKKYEADFNKYYENPEGKFSAEKLNDYGRGEEFLIFKKSIYLEMAKKNFQKKLPFYPEGVPEKELEQVEGDKKLRKEAAHAAKNMLSAARKERPMNVQDIGIASAYRPPKMDDSQGNSAANICAKIASPNRDCPRDDFSLWDKYFQQYFDEILKKILEEDDKRGFGEIKKQIKELQQKEKKTKEDEQDIINLAVTLMKTEDNREKLKNKIRPLKAVPGFSKHSNGTAIDLMTTQDNKKYLPDKNQKEAWKQTWLYNWMVDNASKYGFEPLESEPWHWNYVGNKRKE